MSAHRPVGRFRACDRLRKRSDFTRVQSAGGRVMAPAFIFLVAPGPTQQTSPRLGITASRRVGNAVVRNRAKRLVREAFRATRALLPAGLDLVVIVRRVPEELSLADVIDEFRQAAPRIARRYKQVGKGPARASESSAPPSGPSIREA